MYGLSATDVSKWKENVYNVAEQIVECHLTGRKCPISPIPMETGRISDEKGYFCETCQRIIIGAAAWKDHLHGQKHIKMVKKMNKKKDQSQRKDDTKNVVQGIFFWKETLGKIINFFKHLIK